MHKLRSILFAFIAANFMGIEDSKSVKAEEGSLVDNEARLSKARSVLNRKQTLKNGTGIKIASGEYKEKYDVPSFLGDAVELGYTNTKGLTQKASKIFLRDIVKKRGNRLVDRVGENIANVALSDGPITKWAKFQAKQFEQETRNIFPFLDKQNSTVKLLKKTNFKPESLSSYKKYRNSGSRADYLNFELDWRKRLRAELENDAKRRRKPKPYDAKLNSEIDELGHQVTSLLKDQEKLKEKKTSYLTGVKNPKLETKSSKDELNGLSYKDKNNKFEKDQASITTDCGPITPSEKQQLKEQFKVDLDAQKIGYKNWRLNIESRCAIRNGRPSCSPQERAEKETRMRKSQELYESMNKRYLKRIREQNGGCQSNDDTNNAESLNKAKNIDTIEKPYHHSEELPLRKKNEVLPQTTNKKRQKLNPERKSFKTKAPKIWLDNGERPKVDLFKKDHSIYDKKRKLYIQKNN